MAKGKEKKVGIIIWGCVGILILLMFITAAQAEQSYDPRVQKSDKGGKEKAMAENEVREASNGFYAALNRMFHGDVKPMYEVWSHGSDVTQMGPFGGRRVGWQEVRTEFERAAEMTKNGHVEARDLLIRVTGDLAYTICVEQGENVDREGKRIPVNHHATSIYRRENGEWKLVHHHTDIALALQETIGKGVTK